MGAVAALLAGACVAPVVIQVVLFSSDLYAQRNGGRRSALPFLLGIGMAVPWPIAGAGLTALPKPGAWMVRVKQAFGVFILATAAYYGYLGLRPVRRSLGRCEGSGVERRRETQGRLARVARRRPAPSRSEEQKPVLVDMWATWCKNCLVMDETTLADATRQDGARRIRQDQVPGGAARRGAGAFDHGAVRRRRPAHLRRSPSQDRHQQRPVASLVLASDPADARADENRILLQTHVEF